MRGKIIKQLALGTLLATVTFSNGCRSGRPARVLRYQPISHTYLTAQTHPYEVATVSAIMPVADENIGPHSVDDYLQLGLSQNPEIEEARLLVESLANRVPQAAALPDPMLGLTGYAAPVQTAAGEQDFAVGLNQKFPWAGKRDLRAAIAQHDVIAAQAMLTEVELKVAEQIRNAYFQLHYIEQAITITKEDRQQLITIEEVVDQMYRVKREVTQQDLLQTQIVISQVDNELLKLHQQQQSARARLARLLHISPETELETLDELPAEQTVENIHQLYALAIQARPELLAQLTTIEKDRKSACLAELENYPDLTFGFNYIATSTDGISPVRNGNDALMLTVGMNLPVYKQRISAGVREAQTRALAGTKKYDRLKDEALENVSDSFAKIKSQEAILQLFREEIIPKQKLSLEQAIDEYMVGKVDFLQMIENWRQLLSYHLTEKRTEADLQQSLAALARQVGSLELPASDEVSRPRIESEVDVPFESDETSIKKSFPQ